MQNTSLTVSLPREMKKFIETKLREGSFSTPSEYIRSLIRVDQERRSRRELEAFLRGGLRGKSLPAFDEDDWSAVEDFVSRRANEKREKRRRGRPKGAM